MIARLQVDFAGSQLCLGHDVFGSLPRSAMESLVPLPGAVRKRGRGQRKEESSSEDLFSNLSHFSPLENVVLCFSNLSKRRCSYSLGPFLSKT